MKRPLTAKVHFERFFRMILPAFGILAVGVIAGLSVLVYKVSHPSPVPETVNPSHYLLPYLDVAFPAAGKEELTGWWIPGLKGAPGIILAPGYGMNKCDALSLAAALHETGFNLLIFDQRGLGGGPKSSSTFGLYEQEDMRKAVRFVQARLENNRSRLGIWGVDIGALAAIRVAAECPEIKAVVADCAYENIADFLGYRISEDFGIKNRLVHSGSSQIFKLAHLSGGSFSEQELPLKAVSDRMILFVKGDNRRDLGALTTAIYDKIQPQKEMISFKTARVHLMSGEDLKSYDRQVANFFHLNLQQ